MKYILKELDKYFAKKGISIKKEKSLVERFLESYYQKKERKPAKKYVLKEEGKNNYKTEKKKSLRERIYNAVQLTPPYPAGSEVTFIYYGEKWKGKISEAYHVGNRHFIFSINNAVNCESGKKDSFPYVLDKHIIAEK